LADGYGPEDNKLGPVA